MKKKIKKTSDILKDKHTDPTGSYTGVAVDEEGNPIYEEPVQDVDDL